MEKEISWVDQVLARLENTVNGVLDVQIGGESIQAIISPEFVSWFKNNKPLLLNLGKHTFTNFLLLIHEKREEEAFQVVLSKMSADQIIAKIQQNTQVLAECNKLRDDTIAALKKLALSILTSVATKALLGLLL
jgi:hypothetical protein